MAIYKATKSKGQEREGWSVIFRHPLRIDGAGRPVRMRRGLSTKDESTADEMVEQLNQLLKNQEYWTAVASDTVQRAYNPRVVSIFYDNATPQSSDPWQTREDVIPLPGLNEGYARVRFIGQTGAGKTTLLRQLIGSDPDRDRFPSTSTAKTTTCDIEIILAPDPIFKGVVAFLSEELVRNYVKECVIAAATAAANEASRPEVARRLLEHIEQRFRLSYILGTLLTQSSSADEDDEYEDDQDSPAPELDTQERERLVERLNAYLNRVIALGHEKQNEVVAELELVPHDGLSPKDEDALQDLLEERLQEDEEVDELVDALMGEIKERFADLDSDQLEWNRADWPVRWIFETPADKRDDFIRAVNYFTSNYAPLFGKLLTPLVQGIRVQGPFRPPWLGGDEIPQLVLMDGEGLGHTPESVLSLPTSITRQYDRADTIVLVDNAKQPMQGGSFAVLRSVCASGHQSKLAVVFTHLDLVKGANMLGAEDRKEHVRRSLDNAVNGIKDIFGSAIAKGLKRALDERIFFVGRIQEPLTAKSQGTRNQLGELISVLERPARPQTAAGFYPYYDVANLAIAVRAAMDDFHKAWRARLGLASMPSVYPEHWTRVKALSRRVAVFHLDEYDTLKPVADLIRLFSEHLTPFVMQPRKWSAPPSDDVRAATVDRIRQEVHSRLHSLAFKRLCEDYLRDWIMAFERHGTGSTRVRAQDIRNIYELAAPIPGETPALEADGLMDDIRLLFKESADSVGAQIL